MEASRLTDALSAGSKPTRIYRVGPPLGCHPWSSMRGWEFVGVCSCLELTDEGVGARICTCLFFWRKFKGRLGARGLRASEREICLWEGLWKDLWKPLTNLCKPQKPPKNSENPPLRDPLRDPIWTGLELSDSSLAGWQRVLCGWRRHGIHSKHTRKCPYFGFPAQGLLAIILEIQIYKLGVRFPGPFLAGNVLH